MSKLGRKAKLRSKRRLLAGLVNQFENNTNKRRAAYRSRAPPVQLADSIDEFMRKANVSRATVWRMMKSCTQHRNRSMRRTSKRFGSIQR
jgi:hypothetical protein